MNDNITMRELIEKTNITLEEIFNRPVINKGYGEYDTKNGRDTISMWNIQKMLQDKTGLNLGTERNDITIYTMPFRIKTKRKKSGIIGEWNHTDQMTITEIYLDDEQYLDRIISELKEEFDTRRKAEMKSRLEQQEKDKEDFQEKLNQLGITFKDYQDLKFMFDHLGYQQRREFDPNL